MINYSVLPNAVTVLLTDVRALKYVRQPACDMILVHVI